MANNAPTLSTASPQPTGEKLAWRLWARMSEVFGNRWLTTYGDRPGSMWVEACDKLGAQRLSEGVQALIASGVDHPPSLPRFVALCAPPASQGDVEALAYRMIPSFERNTCTRTQLEAIARANLERARALLTGAPQSPREKNVVEKFHSETSSREIVAGWLEKMT